MKQYIHQQKLLAITWILSMDLILLLLKRIIVSIFLKKSRGIREKLRILNYYQQKRYVFLSTYSIKFGYVTAIELTYYQLVRLINFIRRQSSLGTCFACSNTYSSIEELCQHMTAENHFTQIPDSNHSLWRDPKYEHSFISFEIDMINVIWIIYNYDK